MTNNIMRKFIALIVFILVCVANIYAQQYQEVVYLENGSVVRGAIIEQVPNESLKIQTADGSMFVFKMSDVLKITKEMKVKPVSSTDYSIPKGYRGMVNLSFTFGGGYYSDRLEYTMTHGYQFNPYIFLGAGVGIAIGGGIPIYSNFRVDVPLGVIASPYLDVKLGFDFIGFYGGFNAGCRIALGEKGGINVGLGCQIQCKGFEIRAGYEF